LISTFYLLEIFVAHNWQQLQNQKGLVGRGHSSPQAEKQMPRFGDFDGHTA
jgi:hypothetical protein